MLLMVGVLSSAAVMLAFAAPALATDESYSCEGCSHTTGANHPIDEVAGTDYVYTIVFLKMWKYNGGSNYNIEYETYSETGYHVKICTGGHEFTGHGETTAGGITTHLSGREANYKDCRIP
jgi:hypothetical protein